MAVRVLYRHLRFLLRFRGAAAYYTKPKPKKKASGQAWFLLAGVTTAIASATVYTLGKPEDVIEGLVVEEAVKYADDNVLKAYLLRSRDRILEFKNTFSEPSSKKLLPDLLPHPYQRPYTLVLDLNNLLIHTDYDRNVGWKYQKRPGVDALLASLFDYYEIVVFTSEAAMTGNSIVTALDPNQFIMYRLFRDSTKYIDGQHVKDLSGLNRSLNRVIVVDTNKESVKFHSENALILDKWTGDVHDKTLWDLIHFLQTIAINGVEDTRTVLDYYKQGKEGNEILETFKAYQNKLKEEEEIWKNQEARKRSSGLGKISPFSPFKRNSVDSTPPSLPTIQDADNTTSIESETPQQSWTGWIGSLVGWK